MPSTVQCDNALAFIKGMEDIDFLLDHAPNDVEAGDAFVICTAFFHLLEFAASQPAASTLTLTHLELFFRQLMRTKATLPCDDMVTHLLTCLITSTAALLQNRHASHDQTQARDQVKSRYEAVPVCRYRNGSRCTLGATLEAMEARAVAWHVNRATYEDIDLCVRKFTNWFKTSTASPRRADDWHATDKQRLVGIVRLLCDLARHDMRPMLEVLIDSVVNATHIYFNATTKSILHELSICA